MIHLMITITLLLSPSAQYSNVATKNTLFTKREIDQDSRMKITPVIRAKGNGLMEVPPRNNLCNKKMLTHFIRSVFTDANKPPFVANEDMKYYCPDLRFSCCSVQDLSITFTQFTVGVRETKMQQKNLENTIRVLRDIGVSGILAKTDVLRNEDKAYIQKHLQALFDSFDEMISLSKIFHEELNNYYSAFPCQICDSNSSSYFIESKTRKSDEKSRLLIDSKTLSPFFNIQYLNAKLTKMVQDIQRIFLPFASKPLRFYVELVPLHDPQQLEEEANRYERCWNNLTLLKLKDDKDNCLKEAESQNLVFIFEDYRVTQHLMLVAKILLQEFKVLPEHFGEISHHLINHKIEYFTSTILSQPVYDTKKVQMKISFEKGFDLRYNRLNPATWKCGFIRNVSMFVATALMLSFL